jgi:tetratricopeptide (TPR) repeat protein
MSWRSAQRAALASAIGVLTLAPAGAMASGAPEQWLEPAISAYSLGMESKQRDERQHHFAESERFFAAAIEAGADGADNWTNLGNAALQAERLGPAILAYRRALLLDPGNERAEQNLVYARQLLPEWLPRPSEDGVLDSFFFWRRSLTQGGGVDWAAGCFFLAALALSVGYALGLGALRGAGILLALAWLALIASISLDPGTQASREGVIIVPETVARAADSINAPLRFGDSLASGAEVRVLENRGGWLHVELYNGRDAWLVESAVETVAPREP